MSLSSEIKLGPRTIRDTLVVAAPAALCFDLMVRLDRAPQFFASHLNAEISAGTEGGETVDRWVIAEGGQVRSWRAVRKVDECARVIEFGHAGPARPPIVSVRGRWSFTAESPTTTAVTLEHVVKVADDADADADATDRALRGIEAGSRAQLEQLQAVAERHDELLAQTVQTDATVLVSMPAEAVRNGLVDLVTASGGVGVRLPGDAVVAKWRSARGPVATVRARVATERRADGGVLVAVSAEATAGRPAVSRAALTRWLRWRLRTALTEFAGLVGDGQLVWTR